MNYILKSLFILQLLILNSYAVTQTECEAFTANGGATWDSVVNECTCNSINDSTGQNYLVSDSCEDPNSGSNSSEMDACNAITANGGATWDSVVNECTCNSINNSTGQNYLVSDSCQDPNQLQIDACNAITVNGGATWQSAINECVCNYSDLGYSTHTDILSGNVVGTCNCDTGLHFDNISHTCVVSKSCSDLRRDSLSNCDISTHTFTFNCTDSDGIGIISQDTCIFNGCQSGYHEVNEQCVKDSLDCPTGKHSDNGECVDDYLSCDIGFHDDNGICVANDIPTNLLIPSTYVGKCTHYCFTGVDGIKYAVYARQDPQSDVDFIDNVSSSFSDIFETSSNSHYTTGAFIRASPNGNHCRRGDYGCSAYDCPTGYAYSFNPNSNTNHNICLELFSCSTTTYIKYYNYLDDTPKLINNISLPFSQVMETSTCPNNSGYDWVNRGAINLGNGVNWVEIGGKWIDFCGDGNIQKCGNLDSNGTGLFDDSRLHQDLLDLNLKQDTTNTKLDGLGTSLDYLKTAQDTTNTALNGIGGKIDSTNTALNGIGSKIDSTNTALSGIGSKIDITNTKLDTLNDTMSNLNFDMNISNGTDMNETNSLLSDLLDFFTGDNNDSNSSGSFDSISNLAKNSYDGFKIVKPIDFGDESQSLDFQDVSFELMGHTFPLFSAELLSNIPVNLMRNILLFIAGISGLVHVLRN